MKNLSQSTMTQATENAYSALLKKASLAFIAKDFQSSAAAYRVVLTSLPKIDDEIDCFNKNVVQYMLCISLIESERLQDLQEALETLRDLVGEPNCFPATYNALAKTHIKFFRFDYALKAIHRGFAFLNKDNELKPVYIPETDQIIPESTKKGLLEALYKLKDQCLSWHRPDAVCTMTDCQNRTEIYAPNRNIYFSDPAFAGIVTVMCNNPTYSCEVKFHKSCWEHKKGQMSLQKLTDEEMIGRNCVTPNCRVDRFTPSTITKIEFFDNTKNSKDVVEDSGVLKQSIEDSVVTGAIKKQRNSDNETFLTADENTTEVQEPDLEPDFTNEDEATTAQLKSFSHGLLLSYIETNGPLTTEEVLKKWNETRMMIPNSDSVLNGHKDIIDFMVQSPKVVRVNNYLCVEEMLPQVYDLLKSERMEQFNNATSDKTEYESYEQNVNVNIRNDAAAMDSLLIGDRPEDNECLANMLTSAIRSCFENADEQVENSKVPEYKKEERNNNNNCINGGNSANIPSRTTHGQLHDRSQTNGTLHKRLRLPTNSFKDTRKSRTASNKTGSDSGSRNSLSDFYNTNHKKEEIFENQNAIKKRTTVDEPGTYYQNVSNNGKESFLRSSLNSDNFTSTSQSPNTSTTKQNDNKLDDVDDTNVCNANIKEGENNNIPSDKMFDLLVKEFVSMVPSNDSFKAKQKVSTDPANHSKSVVDFPTQRNSNTPHRNINHHSNQCPDTSSQDTFDELTVDKLKLLLKEKESKIESLAVQNEMLKAGIKNAQLYSKTIGDKYKIMEQNGTVLKNHVDVLLQEKQDSENNLQLLLKEKHSITNIYKDKYEALLKESETHEAQLKQKDEEHNALKLEFFKMKKNMLQKLLDSKCVANAGFIMRNVELCNICIDVVKKFNDIFRGSFGFTVLSDDVEWTQALNGFRQLSAHHQGEYLRRKSLLESKEYIEETTDIVLPLVNIPAFPSRSLLDVITDAFDKYTNMTKAVYHQPVLRNGLAIPYQRPVQHYPVPLLQNHVPQFQNMQNVQHVPLNTYPQFNFTVPQRAGLSHETDLHGKDLKKENTTEITVVKDSNNNKSEASNTYDINAITLNGEKSTIKSDCHTCVDDSISKSDNDKQGRNLENGSKNGAYEDHVVTESKVLMEVDETIYDKNDRAPDKCDDATSLTVTDVQDTGATAICPENEEIIAQAPKQCCYNLDKIMSQLRMKYTGIMDLDLMDSIVNVKRRHNNSLSGMPVKLIIEEAEKYILKCQKKYLCTYSPAEKVNAVKTQESLVPTQNVKRLKPKPSEINKKKHSKPVAGSSFENLMKLEPKACALLKSQRKRLNSTPTDTAGTSVKSKAQPSTQTKCPWGQIPSRNDTWNKEYEETECIICMEQLQCKSKAVYTLACKHTFHMTCIKNWFQHNQSCPNCRIHCTIDDEYPPLPS